MLQYNFQKWMMPLCFTLFSSLVVTCSAQNSGDVRWGELNPGELRITVLGDIQGSLIEVELDEDDVEVTIDGEDFRVDADGMNHVSLRIHGGPYADEIRIVGREQSRLDYFAYLQVYGYDGDDFIQNETDIDMWAYGGRGNDILVGGDGDDVLDGFSTYGESFGLEDNNDSDILFGGLGSNTFKSRYYFYKSTTNYYVTLGGKKHKITRTQYTQYLRLNRQPFYLRGTYYKLSTATGSRYSSAEIGQVLDLGGDDQILTFRVLDGRVISVY